MRTYYVYILKCSDNSYYVGITNDVENRFLEHQEGAHPRAYTFTRRPLELVYYTEFSDPGTAIEVEQQLKGWTRKKKEALINENWDTLKLLAACKNDTHSAKR